MRYCARCHRVWKEGDEFCRVDGHALQAVGGEDDPFVGFEVDGRYRLVSLLGAGGMGFVYLAQQIGLGREVAVKMLYAERSRDLASRKRFSREARALAALDHPGCVRVIDYGETSEGVPFLVMERVSGRPLDALIAVAPLEARHAVQVAILIADAIGAAHAQGVVHRDLKPSNVLLESRGEALRIQLVDFGLASFDPERSSGESSGGRLTRAGVVAGTPEYMAPEQVRGLPAEPRSDLYALGIVLYEMLSGRAPFESSAPADVLALQLEGVPPALDLARLEPGARAALLELVGRLLMKRPDDRPASAADVATALRAIEPRLPDAGPAAVVLLGAPRSVQSTVATQSALGAIAGGDGALIDPFEGLGPSRAADRQLAAALDDDGRARRVRHGAALAIGGVLALGAAAFAGAHIEASQAGPLAPPAAPVRVEVASTPVVTGSVEGERDQGSEILPGGLTQAEYESELRALADVLRARGLRTRDLRAQPRTRELWSRQEAQSRGGDFEGAQATLLLIRREIAELSPRDLMMRRLAAIAERGATGSDALDAAALRALESTIEQAAASPDSTRAFMVRLDDVERRLGR